MADSKSGVDGLIEKLSARKVRGYTGSTGDKDEMDWVSIFRISCQISRLLIFRSSIRS